MSYQDRGSRDADAAATARAALGQVVLALTTVPYVPRVTSPGADPTCRVDHSSREGTAESWERLARTAERRAWAANDAAQAGQSALAAAVGAYARALRAAGMRSRGVLDAVVVAVRESVAPTISVGATDGIVRDARQYGVQAYFCR